MIELQRDKEATITTTLPKNTARKLEENDMARYIEREKFLKKCAEAWGYAGVTIKAIEQIADECTTADVAPKSEGEWYKIDGFPRHHFCKQCGKGNRTKSNYCPNCGAKMKGGAE